MEVSRNLLFVILLMDFWIFSNGADCPVGWKSYKSSCYYFSNVTLTWNQAFDRCIALQGYLVEIEDSGENSYLASVRNSYYYYYIGLSDKDTEGTWKWMTSGKPLSFSSWKPGEPNNSGNEDCAHFFEVPSQWNDTPCSARNRYICEKAKILACLSNPCMNGGTCKDGVDNYRCNCVVGYDGTNCQNDINECFSNPCMNGGICNDGVNNYVCTCSAGYEGTNCQNDINECFSSPCMNGGICNDGVNHYICKCATGYEGTDCQNDIDECFSSPCINGGICNDGVNNYVCTCAAGYEGTNCQNDVNACVSNPCMNDGTCYDGINGYKCDCALEFEGEKCQNESPAVTYTPKASVPVYVFAVVVSVLVLLITACGVFIIIIRRKWLTSRSNNSEIHTAALSIQDKSEAENNCYTTLMRENLATEGGNDYEMLQLSI